MTNHIVKKAVVVFFVLLFIGMTFFVAGTKTVTDQNIIVKDTSDSSTNSYFQQDGNPRHYVMEYVDLVPPEELSSAPQVTGTLPSSFSWITYNGNDWTTPAKDQGYCGSCWAFAAVSALESRINIAWNTPDLDVDLAEQYILSCLPAAGSCAGGSSYSAYRLIQSESAAGNYCNGIVTEDCLPYQADDSVPCSEKASDWRNNLIPISGYGSWSPSYPNDINAIKSQIINEGPVVTYFYVTDDFARWGDQHHNPNQYYPYVSHSSLNHAVAIVGYKDDPSIGNGGYWIVKNSWGTGWGYNGFFNIEYGSLNIDNSQITWVNYSAAPIVAFTSVPADPDIDVPLHFFDSSSPLLGQISSWLWDFGDSTVSEEQNPTHLYSSVGTYLVNLQVTDTTGHVGSMTKKVYVGDDAPPITNSSFSGTLGDNEWYTGDKITIRLKASDSFSGVNYTMTKFDNNEYVQYDGPLFFYSDGNEGVHTFSFYSVDNVGNKESVHTMTFKIDTYAPTMEIIKPKDGRVYILNVGVFLGVRETIIVGKLRSLVQASDSGSGINRAEFYLNDDLVGIDMRAPYTNVIGGGSKGSDTVFSVIVYDNAGRSVTVTTDFKYYGL